MSLRQQVLYLWLEEAALPLEQTIIATVPFRSFGPILSITNPSIIIGGGTTDALVLQFPGFHATRELSAFTTWNRAQNLGDFLEVVRVLAHDFADALVGPLARPAVGAQQQ